MSQITLFSETDKHGTITFVNDAFCDVSKFKKEELLNKPHSIIRHPDMPPKLFEMLWHTLKRDEIFRAVIKNKAKDNSHYWVRATIMPVVSSSREVVKYIGIRHLIHDEQEANAIFAQQVRDLGLDFPPSARRRV